MLGVLPGILGTLQATEALKLVLGIGDPLIGRLLVFDALAMSFDELLADDGGDGELAGRIAAHESVGLERGQGRIDLAEALVPEVPEGLGDRLADAVAAGVLDGQGAEHGHLGL